MYFVDINELLTSDLSLTHYDLNLESIEASDTSDYSIGAVICHEFKDGKVKAVAHASISLTLTEKEALLFWQKKFIRWYSVETNKSMCRIIPLVQFTDFRLDNKI